MNFKSVMLLPLMVASLYATTATKENVTEVYVVDFDRAPDSAGLTYWLSTGLSIEEISQSFFDQNETQERYPDTLSNADFVNTIYKNAFNRDGDADGIVYWTNELESGNITKGNMILAVINGAKDTDLGNDKKTMDNKTEVGLHFADSGSDSVEDATSIMDSITDDYTTVTLAKEEIDGAVNPETGANLILTEGRDDSLAFTSLDDKVSGVASGDSNETTAVTATYNIGDVIDGGDGSDTLTLTFNATTAGDNINATTDGFVTVRSVETVVFQANAATIDAAHWYDVENYVFTKSTDTNVSNIVKALTSITFDDATQTSIDANFTNSDGLIFTGASDEVAIKSTRASGDANLSVHITKDNVGIVEKYAVDISGNGGTTTMNLSDSSIVSVVVTGDSPVVLKTTADTITLVDASAMTKSFDYNSTGTAVTLKGGIEADDLNASDNGDSTVIGGKGMDNINITGAGVDTIEIDLATDLEDAEVDGDTVTGFTTDEDKISIIGLPSGSAENFLPGQTYAADAGSADVPSALIEANKVLNGQNYYAPVLDDDPATKTYLFFDANADGNADGVITLEGVTELKYTDIK
jgi:hypothetical protein